MAVTVIGGALLVILQDVIGLADFLEPCLGLLVAGIAVRVVLHGELAIGLLEVLGACLARHTKRGVIVLLRHLSPFCRHPHSPSWPALGRPSTSFVLARRHSRG